MLMSSYARVGRSAPTFDLPSTRQGERGRVTNADFAGRWLLLMFYPRDFSLVCPTEIGSLAARIDEFASQECEIVAVSVDDLDTHERWMATPQNEGGVGTLPFSLASDPHGKTAERFGAYLADSAVALRAMFLIDPDGVIQFAQSQGLAVGRGSDETLRVLAALRAGGLCAVNAKGGALQIDPERALRPGSVISRYKIKSRVGVGAFGSVLRAEDTKLGREVALKVLRHASTDAVRDMLVEARTAASIGHENIATVYDVEDREGVPLIAMEYLSGGNLETVADGAAASPEDILRYAADVAAGLAAAHARGLVHGDIKPSNVMLTDEGRAKIVDFGLAVHASALLTEAVGDSADGIVSAGLPAACVPERLTAELDLERSTAAIESVVGSLRGSPRYLAPERWQGQPPSAASDVWALGLMLAELATGRPLIDCSSVAALIPSIICLDGAAIGAALPSALEGVIEGCLRQDPAARTDAATLAHELTGASGVSRRGTGSRGEPSVAASSGLYLSQAEEHWLAPETLDDDPRLGGAQREMFLGEERPVVGGVVLLRRLGEGGMGVVFYGVNPRLGHEVAVKLLPQRGTADESLAARFLREARCAARVRSPHIVAAIDVGYDESSGCRYIVMDYVAGVTAHDWARSVRAGGAEPDEQSSLIVGRALATGLAAAHEAGIVHRDVKPANLLIPVVDQIPRIEAARLADMGLARAVEDLAHLTGTLDCLGTPGYMAPEQIGRAREATPAADVFGWGATLHSVLTGRPPFSGKGAADLIGRTLANRRTPLAKLRPDLSEAACSLIERSLHPIPERRPAHGAALLAELARFRLPEAPNSPA